MTSIKTLALVLILFSFNYCSAQNRDSVIIKSIVTEVMTNGTAYENLRDLCKKVGPRLSGSSGFQQAVALTTSQLQQLKLDSVYVQPCMVPHWERGKKEKGWISSSKGKLFDLQLCALGMSVGTAKGGVTGQVVEVKSFDELHRLGEKGIKGKIVFFNFAMNPTYFRTFQAYGESGIARRNGPSQAAKYGALGVLIRSLASNVDPYPHTGATKYNDSFPKIPAVAISTINAENISAELKNGQSLTAHFKTSCINLPEVQDYNVIGEIRGSEFPNEIITVGGHLDSWDLAEGAHDDGSGCMQSIEILRTLKALGIKPKRTIRAVLFANEENGGKGSDKYFEEAKRKNEKHVFAIESDAGGFTPRAFSMEMPDEKMDKLRSWLPLLKPYGITEMYKGGTGSDIDNLKKIGAALTGYNPDSQRYFDLHHAATDVFEAVSKRELLWGAANMAALAWLVSEHGL